MPPGPGDASALRIACMLAFSSDTTGLADIARAARSIACCFFAFSSFRSASSVQTACSKSCPMLHSPTFRLAGLHAASKAARALTRGSNGSPWSARATSVYIIACAKGAACGQPIACSRARYAAVRLASPGTWPICPRVSGLAVRCTMRFAL